MRGEGRVRGGSGPITFGCGYARLCRAEPLRFFCSLVRRKKVSLVTSAPTSQSVHGEPPRFRACIEFNLVAKKQYESRDLDSYEERGTPLDAAHGMFILK